MTNPAALNNYQLPQPVADAPDLIRSQAIWIATGDYDDDGVSGAGDIVADMGALQRATDAANALATEQGAPVIVDGSNRVYYIRAGLTRLGYRFGETTRPYYGGIELKSNVYYRNCVFKPAPMLTTPSEANHLELMFYTLLENARDTYENIGFIDCTFDFGSAKYTDLTTVAGFVYGVGATGINGFLRRNCRLINSRSSEFIAQSLGSKRGRGLLLFNSDNTRIEGDYCEGLGQAIFAGYLYRVQVDGGFMQDFNEGYDFDDPCWDVSVTNMQFRDASGADDLQCIDYGSGARWYVSNIFAQNTGTIFQVYLKPWAWPDFEQFVAAAGAAVPEADCGDLVVPEHVVIDGIFGENTGRDADGVIQATHGSLMIGGLRQSDTWTAQGYTNTLAGGLGDLVGVRRVFVTNVNLRNGAGIYVGDCDDLAMSNILLDTCTTEDSSGDTFRNAALVIRQSAASADIDSVTRVNGYARDITIISPTGGAVYLTRPGDFLLDNVKVRGFNTANSANSRQCVAIRQMGKKAGLIQIGKIDLEGGNSSSDVLLNMSAIDPVAGEFRVQKTGGWNLKPENSAQYFTSSGRVGDRWAMAYEQHKITNYDTTVATGSALIEYDVGAVATNYRVFIGGKLEPTSDVADKGATNNTRFGLRKKTAADPSGADVSSLGSVVIDNGAKSKRTVLTLSGDSFLNSDVLTPGDIWTLALKRADGGTGSSYTGDLFATLFYFDFVSVG